MDDLIFFLSRFNTMIEKNLNFFFVETEMFARKTVGTMWFLYLKLLIAGLFEHIVSASTLFPCSNCFKCVQICCNDKFLQFRRGICIWLGAVNRQKMSLRIFVQSTDKNSVINERKYFYEENCCISFCLAAEISSIYQRNFDCIPGGCYVHFSLTKSIPFRSILVLKESLFCFWSVLKFLKFAMLIHSNRIDGWWDCQEDLKISRYVQIVEYFSWRSSNRRSIAPKILKYFYPNIFIQIPI